MSFLLTGKNDLNKINLLGKNKRTKDIPHEIQKIKIRILNLFILPILSKQWLKFQENLFLLDQLKEKIDKYYQRYKIEDLLLYKDLLDIFGILVEQHIQLEDMENKMYGKDSDNQIISMIYRTTMIKLKPEYELYNSIIGKPKREENKSYNEDIISDIQKYMVVENITYQMIKDLISNKYLSTMQ
jgi:hypothetical protein